MANVLKCGLVLIFDEVGMNSIKLRSPFLYCRINQCWDRFDGSPTVVVRETFASILDSIVYGVGQIHSL